MVDIIYCEQQVFDHERSQKIMERYPRASVIEIDRYGEVFNSNKQHFRLQKNNPSLILAAKQNKRVLETPSQYETGGGRHYYFSHMLNCIYDCRYCFLQGMMRSANYVVFVNYEDFLEEIEELAHKHKSNTKPTWFFSGYDCDSLAYEPVSRFAEHFVSAFASMPNGILELRTKSTQIRSLMDCEPNDNVVVAYSLSPEDIVQEVEKGTPSLSKRISALESLQQRGWRIGLRFDPVIWHENFSENYARMITDIFDRLDAGRIDSVTIGSFRLPRQYFKRMRALHPQHWLFHAGLSENDGQIVYAPSIEQDLLGQVAELSEQYIAPEKVFVYSNYT